MFLNRAIGIVSCPETLLPAWEKGIIKAAPRMESGFLLYR